MIAAASPDLLDFVETFVYNTPPGSAMILQNVSWEEYERYLHAVDGKVHVRLSYDDGRLEIMSLSPEHEFISHLFPYLILVLAQECALKFLSLGSTTMRKRPNTKGLEPDDCYYFNNLDAIRGLERMDMDVTPPPDLALEIDITSPSLSKEPIYAALGVPELWRHTGKSLHFFRLSEGSYIEIDHSALFPFLTPGAVQRVLLQGELTDVTTMTEEFRVWVNAHKS
jgi:Uma2 family endonuclease